MVRFRLIPKDIKFFDLFEASRRNLARRLPFGCRT